MAKDPPKAKIILAGGKLELTVPSTWTEQEPKFRAIVTQEFVVAKAKEDKVQGRVTVGGAGGGVEAITNYWRAQYFQPDGKPTSERTEVKEIEVAGQKVTLVDITGTYRGSEYRNEPRQANFRMLGAIIATENLGRYYVKFYGPRQTVAAQEKAFRQLVHSLVVKK